jgi:hypothetical protein
MTVITSTLKRPGGALWKFGEVTIGRVGPGFDGTGIRILGVQKYQADATAALSLDLVPTAAGEYNVWTDPDGEQFYFDVPASGGPYTLSSRLLTTPVPPALAAVTTQALNAAIAALNGVYARFDAAQTLTSGQQAQIQSNIGIFDGGMDY